MRYFLVNNDYHLYDLSSLQYKKKDGDTLIKVPHSLGDELYDLSFDHILEFRHFYLGLKSLFNYGKIKQSHRAIDKLLRVENGDILFVYTDNEILNQYIISKFYNKKCKVYMLEDGLATALVYNLSPKKLPFKEYLKLQILKYLYGYTFTSVVFENKNYYPVINEEFITSILFYLKTSINRNIPVKYLKNNVNRLPTLNPNVALFLNQDTYRFDQTEESYFEDLTKIFLQIHKNFKQIVFKFHPREAAEFKIKIKNVLSNYPNIQYIDTFASVESIISNFSPKYAISYYSSSLKNLFFFGIQPVFIYHLLPTISNNEFSKILNKYLKNLNYNFPKSLQEINVEYQSGLTIPNQTLTIDNLA